MNDPIDREEPRAERHSDDETVDEVELVETDLLERWTAWANIIDR